MTNLQSLERLAAAANRLSRQITAELNRIRATESEALSAECDRVVEAVGKVFGVSAATIRARTREQQSCDPRQVVMWLLAKKGWPSKTIATAFAKHFGTVDHARWAIERRRDTEPKLKAVTDALAAELGT